jgi:hypothetical protein
MLDPKQERIREDLLQRTQILPCCRVFRELRLENFDLCHPASTTHHHPGLKNLKGHTILRRIRRQSRTYIAFEP